MSGTGRKCSLEYNLLLLAVEAGEMAFSAPTGHSWQSRD